MKNPGSNNGSDLRLRDYIRHNKPTDPPLIDLISFPTDKGVMINNGRPGSAKAPELIRARLFNRTPDPVHFEAHTALLRLVSDQGSVPCDRDLASDQAILGSKVSLSLQNESIPVIIGGGHETAYGHFLGYAEAGKPVTIINIDAHADVRHLKNGSPHSGSPFRQAIEHESGVCRGYHVFGLNPSSVAIEHDQYVRKHGSAHYIEDFDLNSVLESVQRSDTDVMITLDMDAVDQSQAPGVSAPNANGLSTETWLKTAFTLGKNSKITSFDLCEVNPVYDQDGQTVRLAAMTIWYFLLGVALRDDIE